MCTDALVLGCLLAYAAAVILMMAFCSPYWIESYEESFSNFKNMGLWEYCFKDFSYPYYQFPRTFNGCHNIFSHVSIYAQSPPSQQMTWYNGNGFRLFFTGILCHTRMACARLAYNRSGIHNNCIHFDILLVGCNGTGTNSMAIENGAAIRMANDSCFLYLLCNFK